MMPCPAKMHSHDQSSTFSFRLGNAALTKQVPQGLLHEVALSKDALILEDKLEVARVVDHDARGQAGDV